MTKELHTVEELKKFDVNLCWIYRRELAEGDGSGKQMPSDNFLTMWFIEDGEVAVETEGEGVKKATSGQWFICSQGKKRIQNFIAGTKIISVWLDIKYPDHGQPVFSNLPVVIDDYHAGDLKKDCEEIINHLQNNGLFSISPLINEKLPFFEAVALKCKSVLLFNDLVSVLAENGCGFTVKRPVDVRVKKAMKLLEEIGYTGKIPYEQLSMVSGLGRVQIDRLFVKELGLTPKDYLSQKCVDSALHYLRSGNFTVKEIAYRLNFMNSGHFCTWFKRQTGKSPKQAKSMLS